MKLSNRILVAFFGFIFIYLTAAFTEIRFRGTHSLMNDSNIVAETEDITGIRYLILSDLGKTINVIGSDRPRIEIRSISGDLLQNLKYNISGDTLTLSQFDLKENEGIKISVFVHKNRMAGMMVNGAVVTVEGLDLKDLSIYQNAGLIRIEENNKLASLQIKATNKASFYMAATDVGKLSAVLDNSEAIVDSPVRLLEGSIKNNSYVRTGGIDEIQFKKDESSKLQLY